MKKTITWAELLAVIIPIVMAIGASWLTMRDTQNKQEIRIQYLENSSQKVNDKLDKITDELETVRLLLENKQNRKE